jgi:CRISPR-associated protein Csm4
MGTYAITIKPTSPFGTPLKGDTIFGHFCWQAAQDQNLLNGGLDVWIAAYPQKPFAVFSSAWPLIPDNGKTLYAMKRPELPAALLAMGDEKLSRQKRLEARKENKAKKWLLVGDDLRVSATMFRLASDHDLFERCLAPRLDREQQTLRLLPRKQQKLLCAVEQQHNTIDRLTMTTGKGFFAPYAMENIHFLPDLELAIFAFIDEEATDIERMRDALTRIGHWGFGRDASTGLGRFEVAGCDEVHFPKIDTAEACYTLGPCVPEKETFRQAFFAPFTRFGRHGAPLVLTGKPFKNPVVMADEGAVFYPNEQSVFGKPYIGRAVTTLSKAEPNTVAQGYSLYLPL